MISERDLGWVAGFLEGEGSFMCAGGADYYSMRITACQVQRSPLEKLQALLGGKIYRNPKPPWQEQARWVLQGPDAAGWMMILYTLMSPGRRAKIRAAFDRWKSHRPHARYRTHCPSGHQYTKENTHVIVTHRRYPARVCCECRRIQSRAGYRRMKKRRRWARGIAELAAIL